MWEDDRDGEWGGGPRSPLHPSAALVFILAFLQELFLLEHHAFM